MHALFWYENSISSISSRDTRILAAVMFQHLTSNVTFYSISCNDQITFEPFTTFNLDFCFEAGIHSNHLCTSLNFDICFLCTIKQNFWTSPRWMTLSGAPYLQPIPGMSGAASSSSSLEYRRRLFFSSIVAHFITSSKTPKPARIRVTLRASCIPAPTSLICQTYSRIMTWWPVCWKPIAVVKPAIPAPMIKTFNGWTARRDSQSKWSLMNSTVSKSC